jgi:hypothetical protein
MKIKHLRLIDTGIALGHPKQEFSFSYVAKRSKHEDIAPCTGIQKWFELLIFCP